jgi:hypothetical protein
MHPVSRRSEEKVNFTIYHLFTLPLLLTPPDGKQQSYPANTDQANQR